MLTSISKVISKYSIPFDKDGSIVAKKAAENNITIGEQKAIWEKKGLDSRTKGTEFHKDVETYLKTKKIPNTSNKKLVKQFSKIKFNGILYSEVRLFSSIYGIAGTTDLVELLKDNSISLSDFKTNAKLSSYSFGKKMLYPLNNIWDSVMDKYTIQISAYAYMLEKAGWWIRDLNIFHIDYIKEKIKHIPMENRRNDVIRMLEHYRENYYENDCKTAGK